MKNTSGGKLLENRPRAASVLSHCCIEWTSSITGSEARPKKPKRTSNYKYQLYTTLLETSTVTYLSTFVFKKSWCKRLFPPPKRPNTAFPTTGCSNPNRFPRSTNEQTGTVDLLQLLTVDETVATLGLKNLTRRREVRWSRGVSVWWSWKDLKHVNFLRTGRFGKRPLVGETQVLFPQLVFFTSIAEQWPGSSGFYWSPTSHKINSWVLELEVSWTFTLCFLLGLDKRYACPPFFLWRSGFTYSCYNNQSRWNSQSICGPECWFHASMVKTNNPSSDPGSKKSQDLSLYGWRRW